MRRTLTLQLMVVLAGSGLLALSLLSGQAPVHSSDGSRLFLPLSLRLGAPEQPTTQPSPAPSHTVTPVPTGLPATAVPTAPSADTPSPPGLPTIVSQVGGTAFALVVVGERAYLATGSAITVYSIRDPAQPVAVGRSVSLNGLVSGLAMHGADLVAAVSAGRSSTIDGAGLAVLDLSDPDRPEVRSTLPLPTGANDVAVAGDYVLATSGSFDWNLDPAGALTVVDLRDAAAPRVTARLVLDFPAGPVVTADGYAYVACPFSFGGKVGATVVDVSDPAHPAIVAEASRDESLWFLGLAVGDGYLAGVDAFGGVTVFRVTNPRQPVLRGIAHCAGCGESAWPALLGLAIHDGRLLAVGDHHVMSVPLADLSPDAWLEAPTTPLPISGAALVVSGNRAVVAANWNTPYTVSGYRDAWYLGGGLVVLEFDDPAAPTLVGASPGPSADAVAVTALGDRLLVAEGGRGLQGAPRLVLLGATEPERPIPLGVMDLPSNPRGLAVAGDMAFVLTADALLTVDAGGAGPPRVLASVPLPAPQELPATVLHEQGQLFVLSQWQGPDCVSRVDVRDPLRPVFATDCAIHARAIGSNSDGLLVSADDDALTLWRVEGLSAPTQLGSLAFDAPALGTPFNLTIAGTTVLLTTTGESPSPAGLLVADISQPAAPRALAELPTLPDTGGISWAYHAVALGRTAVLANLGGHLLTLDLADPRRPLLGPALRVPFVDAACGQSSLGGFEMQALAWRGLAVVVEDSGLTIVRPK